MQLRTLLSNIMKLSIATVLALTGVLGFAQPPETASAQSPEPSWIGEYYDNGSLAGSPVFTRTDSNIVFDWQTGSPDARIPADGFSVRWITDATFEAGTYRFWALADDNIRITIDFRRTIIDTFESDQVDELVAADVELSAGSHRIQVDYREVNDDAFAFVDFANLAANPTGPDFRTPTSPTPQGIWAAQYYANPVLAGAPTITTSVNMPGADWGTGSPSAAIPNDNWSARWTTSLDLSGGDYRVRTTADDGVRVYIDGALVINEWHIASGVEYTATRNLAAGNHSFTVEFYEATGLAFLDFTIEQVTTQPQPPLGPSVATVVAGPLNVRDAPSVTNGDIIASINFQESYTALARNASGTWVKLSINGIEGWVSTRFVTVTNFNQLPIQTNTVTPTGFTVTATPFGVNIRGGASTDFDILDVLPVGQAASVIGRNSDATWWQIEYDGVIGWVSAFYARIEDNADLSQIPVTN